jgi:hypothetical protein
MPEHLPYEDPTLGTAVWDDAEGWWKVTVFLPSGQKVDVSVIADGNSAHLSSPDFNETMNCIRYIRDNESVLRQFVADEMYDLMLDWHDDDEGPALSKTEFRDKLTMMYVSVDEDHGASVFYNDAGCFGDNAIMFDMRADGQIVRAPFICG